MRDTLTHAFDKQINDIKLVPGASGSFEILADGRKIYSKLSTGQFPSEDDIVDQLSSMYRA